MIQSIETEHERRDWKRLQPLPFFPVLGAWVGTMLVFVIFAWRLAPDVNESHYLTKAKHFWNPEWCATDIFLESTSAHLAFYFLICWPLKFLSLPTFAFIGRAAIWALAAWGWSRWMIARQTHTLMVPLLGMIWLLLIQRAHLAGEWVIGGLEAKSLAYACILNACAELHRERFRMSAIYIGMAILFHLLVGFWFSLAVGLGTFFSLGRREFGSELRQSIGKGWGWLVLIFLIGSIFVGAIPSLLADIGVDARTREVAAQIQVLSRLDHHLFFPAFSTARVAMFAGLLIATYLFHRIDNGDKVNRFWRSVTLVSLGFSFGGLILSAMVESRTLGAGVATSLLRLYWFRLADFTLPTLTVLSIGSLLKRRSLGWGTPNFVVSGSLVLLAAAFVLGCAEQWQDRRPPADQAALPTYLDDVKRTQETYENWRRVCDWIRDNTPETAIFITPADQQTFKWYADRSEVVNWKDMPQDALSLAEWYRRAQSLILLPRNYSGGIAAYSDQQLRALGEQYYADFLVVAQADWNASHHHSELRQIYPPVGELKTYVVVELD